MTLLFGKHSNFGKLAKYLPGHLKFRSLVSLATRKYRMLQIVHTRHFSACQTQTNRGITTISLDVISKWTLAMSLSRVTFIDSGIHMWPTFVKQLYSHDMASICKRCVSNTPIVGMRLIGKNPGSTCLWSYMQRKQRLTTPTSVLTLFLWMVTLWHHRERWN